MSAIRAVADRAYRDTLEESARRGEPASVSDLRERVAGALIESVGFGVVSADEVTRLWAENEARQTDQRHTSAGRDVVRQFSQGQLGWIDLLDVVCAIGEGGRVLFRDMGATDMVHANELRYANVRAAQQSFHEWTTEIFNRAMPVLVARGCTLGQAITNGWIN